MSRRYVVFGAGAVGGVVGARLHEAGHDVALIARGAHLEAIRRDGLTLRTPTETLTRRIEAAADPADLSVGPRDVVLLAVKSQDTLGALDALAAAGALDAPLVCLQNGVENERAALRVCPSVHGAVIMCPTAHLRPGVVDSYGARYSGMIDVGDYPAGAGEVSAELVAALNDARFIARVLDEVMRGKYAKLLLNLGNAVGALLPSGEDRTALTERARAEGREVLRAAGIAHDDDSVGDMTGRWEEIGVSEIDGEARSGSSSWQSLARSAGAIETDYLNGEIALLGRLHGVPAPLNAALCRLAADAARRGAQPGSLTADEVLAAMDRSVVHAGPTA